MTPERTNRPGRAWQRATSLAAALAGCVGSLALMGWALDIPALKSILPGWVAMKANTAVCFLLSGLALWLMQPPNPRSNAPQSAIIRLRLAQSCAALVALIAALTLCEYLFGSIPGLDQWLFFEPPGAVGTSHPGRMAPDTALCFTLLAVGLEISRTSRQTTGWAIALSILSSLVMAIALVEILSYFTPALRTYGWGGLTMMALPTATVFGALGAALFLIAWQEGMSESASPARPPETPGVRAGFVFLAVFFLLAVGILAGGAFYYRHYERQFRAEVERQISATADLKVMQIADWRRERLAEANYLRHTPYTARRALDVLAQPDSATTRAMFTASLDVLLAGGQLDHALLLDGELNVRLVHPRRGANVLSEAERQAAGEALRSRQVALADLHRVSNGPVYLSLMVPLVVRREGDRDNVPAAGTTPSPTDRSAAVLVLRINANTTLYPVVNRWPTSSRTAETLLVRRDANDALFLNELRFRTNTALHLRASLANTNMPAVKAVLGQKGIVDGRDYRNVPVIADLRPVPGSPWFVVARMDTAEVYAPLRERFWQMILLLSALLISAGSCVGLVWRQQHLRFYQEKAAAAEAIRQSEARYKTLVEHIPQKIFLKDRNFRWVSVNQNFARDLGLAPEEVVGKLDFDFFPEELAEKYRADDERVMRTGQTEDLEEKYVQGGREHWVHVVKTPVRDERGETTGLFGIFWDITERRRALEALCESEASLREAQRIAGLGSYVLHILSGLWTSSDVLDDLFGIDEAYARSVEGWMALVHPDDRVMMGDYFKNEVLGQGRTFDKEYRILRPADHAERWVHGLGKLEFDPQGRPVKMHGTIQDISERKRAEDVLRNSESKLRAILDATPFPIAMVDLQDNNIVFWSRSALTLFGHTAPTAPEWYQLAYPDSEYQGEVIRQWKPALEKARLSGQSVNAGEYRIACRDGSVRFCELYAAFLSDNLIVTFHDVTQRKRADEALRASEERFRRAVLDAPFPILLHAEDGTILQASNSWCEITGYTREELRTIADWTERAYGERKVMIQPEIEALYGMEHRKYEGDYTIRVKDGTMRIWEFSSGPLGRLPDGRRLVISMALDVTERRTAEHEVRQLNAELEQRVQRRTTALEAANKELEAFSYSVSHDLRAPLRAIDGYGRILVEDYANRLDAEGRRVLAVISSETQRMGRLIDELLAFSRLSQQPLNYETVFHPALVRRALDDLLAAQPGRRIEWTVGNLPATQGDPALLRQVWVNLLSNAVKYTKTRNPAVIEVGVKSEVLSVKNEAGGGQNPTPLITDDCSLITDHRSLITYFVRDNGVGFDMQYSGKLFGVFQRLHTESEFEGTGVGLALVQRIIHRHGGRVWAEGKVNQGATFYFTLPMIAMNNAR